MTIDDLKKLSDDMFIKIGKTSITVKDKFNKTRGIIKDINTFNTLTSRRKFQLPALRILMQNNINMEHIIIVYDNIYYIIDISSYNKKISIIEKYKNDLNFDIKSVISELEKTDKEIKLCKNNNVNILKVNLA